MKEATGEMTTTIIVIIALVAVLTLGTTVIWPKIQQKINTEIDDNFSYIEVEKSYNI